jgi:hypothetical protein
MPFSKSIPALRPTFLLQPKKSLATKVLNRTKRLILGMFQMSPSNFHSNGIPRGGHLPFAAKISLFVLKL